MMKDKNKGKPAGVQLLMRCVVRDPEGKVISDTGHKPARSFVIQFLEFIYAMGVAGTTYATTTGESGNPAEWFYYQYQRTSFNIFRIVAPVGEDTFGIVVGTGDTAATNADYKLETKLTHGVGAGDITYGEQIGGSAALVGANVDLEIKRAFTNNTGSAITVKEAGVYVTYNVGYEMHCIIRDVLGAGVPVPDKCSLTIIYTLRTTV